MNFITATLDNLSEPIPATVPTTISCVSAGASEKGPVVNKILLSPGAKEKSVPFPSINPVPFTGSPESGNFEVGNVPDL